MTEINLYGRVLITAQIEAVTGLHIGGSSAGLEIGGVDKAVIRNPLSGIPYIPGSSLRGKMRSQTEKVLGLAQNNKIGQVTIHTCKTRRMTTTAMVAARSVMCSASRAKIDYSGPTRLAVRDTPHE